MRMWAGIDVGGTTIKAAAVTEEGVIAAKVEEVTEPGRGAAAVFDKMVLLMRRAVRQAGWRTAELSGVGVGLPAFLDRETGMAEEAINLGWRQVPVAEELRRRLGGVPFAVDNDANAAALGEALAGAGQGFASALCLTIGTGVGSGIVLEGRLWHGATGMAGEIGHITVDPEGRACNCGRRGCLETVASANGMVAEVAERIAAGVETGLPQDRPFDAREVFAAAAEGDPAARAAVSRAIDRLGFVLAGVGATLNPHVIVIGGGVSAAGEALLYPLRAAFAKYALPRVQAGTRIRLARLGNDAGVIGAALLQKQTGHATMEGNESRG